ncbi:MAG: NADH-quinone oxidoreductase subunit B family protein [Chloroflexota bacterium]
MDLAPERSPVARSTVKQRIPGGDPLTSSAEREKHRPPGPERAGRLLGPVSVVHVYWLAGMSCDGCTIAVSGATEPALEDLLGGRLPGVPRVVLHHYVLSTEAGAEYVHNYEMAASGQLDAPYVVVYEGSVPDERLAKESGGYWASMGTEEVDGETRPIPTATWLSRLAPGAAAVIAIGTCATWGGIPGAAGNPTGAMSVMDFLGPDYLSNLGLPVVNVPGCSPIGDDFTEAVAAILLFLNGYGPLPEFDDLGRPAWQFNETVHRHCPRAGYYEEGVFAQKYGDRQCLVEIGCWGPVVQCHITEHGAIDHRGGCMKAGGICIGCMMPGFPDRFSPFYKRPPGTLVSATASTTYGVFVRKLRSITQEFLNREKRWDRWEEVPSGWGHVNEPSYIKKVIHFFYEKLQFQGAEHPGRSKPYEEFPGGYEVPPVRAGKVEPPYRRGRQEPEAREGEHE